MTPDFRLTQGNDPKITATLTDDADVAVDLSQCTVIFRAQMSSSLTQIAKTATITNNPGADGAIECQLTAADTAIVGWYQAQWEVTYPDGAKRSFPTGSLDNTDTSGRYIWFEIVPAIPAYASATQIVLLRQMYEPVRVCLGDFNAQFQKYSDDAISSVLRTCLLIGKVPGQTLGADRLSITPGITLPTDMALLMNWGAKMFLRPTTAEWRIDTRTLSQKQGRKDNFLWDLDNAIYDLENPVMFASFQSFYAWVNSLTGIDIWSVLSDMKTNAPVATVNIGRAGVTVSTT